MESIVLKDCGPIEQLTIPLPEDGGVVELLGRNGAGKSHALDAADLLTAPNRKKVGLSVRDGASRASVTGLGVTISFAKRMNRVGELVCESLDGKLSLGDIIKPKYETDLAADAQRIKAICSVSGAEVKAERFFGLLDKATFDKHVEASTKTMTDPVELARRIRLDLSNAALQEEKLLQAAQNSSVAAQQAADLAISGVEKPEVNSQGLNCDIEDAVGELARLRTELLAYEKALIQRGAAQMKLREFNVSQDLGEELIQLRKTLITNEASLSALEKGYVSAREMSLGSKQIAKDRYDREVREAKARYDEQVASLDKELVDWSNDVGTASERVRLTGISVAEKEKVLASHKELASILDLPLPEGSENGPKIAFLEKQLSHARQDYQKAVEYESATKQAALHKKEADKHLTIANLHLVESTKLRDAAKNTDDVLSEIVSGLNVPLKVIEGRLYTQTDRGLELLSELSAGEIGKLAIDIGISALTSDNQGVMVIKQEVWEGIDDVARTEIHEHAKKNKVVILTARHRSTDGIVAEEYAGKA